MKLPDRSNDGAKRGSICHLVFECLGEKRHKKHYDLVIKKKDIFASKAIERMVMKHARRDGVDSEDNIQQIKDMTLAGLEYDFFGNDEGKPTQALSEEDFDFDESTNPPRFRTPSCSVASAAEWSNEIAIAR